MWSERGQGAPQVKGNSHGTGIKAIVCVLCVGCNEISPFARRESVNRSSCAKFDKACAEIDRKSSGANRMDIGK
jgi:hypothetical protein